MGRTAWASRPKWACIVLSISVTSWLAPMKSFAQPLPITWEAPSGCPSLADVTSWLEAVVPAELRTRLAGVEAEVRITRVERRYHAAIRVTHGAYSGEREVDGRRCEEVARSAIVVVSVSLAEAVEQVEAPPPPVEEPPRTVPAPVEEPERLPFVEERIDDAQLPEAPTPEPSALVLDITGGAAFALGTPPLAPRVSVGVHRPITLGLTLGGRLRAVPRTWFDERAESATLTLLALGVELCGRYSATSIVHLLGCARGDVGVVLARGRDGFDQTLRGAAPFVSAVLAPALEVGRKVRLRIAPELEARIVRPRLTVDEGEGTDTLYRIPLIGGSIDLGLVILFP